MDLRDIAGAVILLILCIGAMALFPVAHGPYSAVHGPTTSLRERRLVWLLRTSIALAASVLAARLIHLVTWLSPSPAAVAQLLPPDSTRCPLRC